MQYRKLGKTDIEASVIALGTWVMGGWMWGGSDDNESITAIHAALDAGINLIDTAPVYGFGHSEEVVGKAIKGRREEVVLATKCGLRWDMTKGIYYKSSNEETVVDDGNINIYKYLGAASIREEIERSLKRLQTDYIDLYQTHWQESTTPVEETMETLLRLKDEGKIRAIGVSNANVEQMKQYCEIGELTSDQEKFNMLQRGIEDNSNTEFCSNNDISILAYSPIAQGLLTGKFLGNSKFKNGDVRETNPLFEPANIEKVNKMLGEFRTLAEEYEINTYQLVLAWTYHRKGITHILCGARNKKQAISNAQAGSVKLGKSATEKMNLIYGKYFN